MRHRFSSTPALSLYRHVPRAFVWALGFFAAGMLAAACMAVAAYSANHLNADSLGAKRLIWEYPFVEVTQGSAGKDWWARGFHTAAYVCAAASLLALLGGPMAAVVGFVYLR